MGSCMIFILVTLAVVSQQSYGEDIDERVLHGYDAYEGQFPYHVFVFSFNYSTPLHGSSCGGALISRRYVLTAIHCIVGTEATSAYLGMTYIKNMYTTAVKYTVEHNTVIQHDHFNSMTLENDIAVIKLPEEVKLTYYIQTIALPKLAWASPDYFNNHVFTLSGFGQTHDYDSNIPHPVLQYTYVHKMPQAKCKKALPYHVINDGMLCADKSTYSGSCEGDSGGPLAVTYFNRLYLVGLVDWGVPPCDTNYPGVYTNVAHYLKWINNVTGIPIR